MEEAAKFLASCEFSTPLYSGIGVVLVLLLIFFPWARKRRGLAIDLQYWRPRVAFKSKRVRVLSIPVVIISILMAGVLSDPRVPTRPLASIYGKPVMLVVDVSGSMVADVGAQTQRTGFEEAREAFNDFIARRAEVNYCLVIYTTENYVARYFTYKNELFADTLDNTEEINYISAGTRTAEALAKARQFLADNIETEADKAIVLIYDMQTDLKAMLEMAEEMDRILRAGINVYIIAIGAEERGAVAIPQMSGLKVVDVDDKEGIDQICEEISAMQSSPVREEEGLLKNSLIPLLILPALALITLSLLLGETRFRKIP